MTEKKDFYEVVKIIQSMDEERIEALKDIAARPEFSTTPKDIDNVLEFGKLQEEGKIILTDDAISVIKKLTRDRYYFVIETLLETHEEMPTKITGDMIKAIMSLYRRY